MRRKFCNKHPDLAYKTLRCPVCQAVCTAAWRSANQEKIKVSGAAYRKTNPEKIRAKSREWVLANPEKIAASSAARYKANPKNVKASCAAWRSANPEKVKADNAKWYKANTEKARVDHAVYYKVNADKLRARSSAWCKDNPEKVTARNSMRRATKLNATPGWANEFFINEAYALARLRTSLQTGGVAKWHVDHIVPLQSKLVCGLHTEQNMRVIPASHNITKGNRCWPDMPEKVA